MRNGSSELSCIYGGHKKRLLMQGKRLEMEVVRIATVIFTVAATAIVAIFMIRVHGMVP